MTTSFFSFLQTKQSGRALHTCSLLLSFSLKSLVQLSTFEMSRSHPIDITQDEIPRPWFTLPSAIPPLTRQSGRGIAPGSGSPFLPSLSSSQPGPVANDEQSVQQTERPWVQRIVRGPQEPLNFYIARMEAECSHKPRPVRAQGESREDYAQRLWLRVYNKYCKRRSRKNERANYEEDSNGTNDDGNGSRSERSPPQSRRQSVGLSHSNREPASSSGQQEPPHRSYNDQEGRAALDAQRRILAQAAAGARLQEHIRDRAQQGVNMEQYFRLTLGIPSHETVFNGTTSRFHGSFAEIAKFVNLDQDGARVVLQREQSNTGAPSPR